MAKTRTSFTPGHGGGRPKGVKNKNYVDASFWLGKAHELLEHLEKIELADQKLAIIKWATELIASRVPMIPSTPADSKANALAAQQAADEFIKKLETEPETSDAAGA